MSPEKRRRTRTRNDRTPSPSQRSLRPRLRSPEASEAPANGPRNKQITSDELVQRLKTIKGPTPRFVSATITDYDNKLMYAIDSRKDIRTLYIWVLRINTMTWENIPITHHVSNAFIQDQKEFPFRARPCLELWGPVDHRRLLLFGGTDASDHPTKDFFSVDLVVKTWTQVLIEGGDVEDYDEKIITIFEENKLCLFGIYEKEDRPNTFSIAERNTSTGVWTWKILAKSLPKALHNVVNVSTIPLSDSKKLLLIGCSVNKKHTEITVNTIFTFDPLTCEFVQEDAARGFPRSTMAFVLETDLDRAICSTQKKTDKGYVHYLWVYAARPFNIWKSVAPIGPFKGLVKYGVVVLGGKLCALLEDKRKGSYGMNAYMELEDLIEDTQN